MHKGSEIKNALINGPNKVCNDMVCNMDFVYMNRWGGPKGCDVMHISLLRSASNLNARN